MKTAKEYLDEANARVPRVTVEEALQKHAEGTALFVDVRDSAAIAKTGTIAGAQRVPRGFLEFAADDATPHHNPALTREADIYLVCGAGGQAALAGHTLKEMGFTNVHNIGGIGDWKSANGPMED